MGTESILLEMPFTRVDTHLAIPDFVRCTLLESQLEGIVKAGLVC